MIATFVAALALAGGSPVDPPVAVPAETGDSTPLKEAHGRLDRAQRIYQQSCADRAYGAYDDLCEQLSIQMRQIRNEVDKLERAEAQKPTKTQTAQPKS
jgi:hypothetical protein